jgi:UTP:GlnB (protein PII) uridylyltransferase
MMVEPRAPIAREVHEFLASMPVAYARAFSAREVEEHVRIVARRGGQLAHAEAIRGASETTFVCVVADDQPGLLSFVTDALLVHGLSVASAELYCRRCGDGKLEAVDFFSLEPAQSGAREQSIEPAELASFAQTLRELIAEDQLISQQPSDRDTIPVPGPKPCRVYFELEALRRGEYVLIVEAPDFAGLLFAISSALHGQGIRITASKVRTEHGQAKDRFQVESIGSRAMNAERLCDVQQAVLSAVQAGTSKT